MSENARSTQFGQFAELLWNDVINRLEFWIDTAEDDFTPRLKEILAERLYDFAGHVLLFGVESVDEVPDMEEWPVRKEQE